MFEEIERVYIHEPALATKEDVPYGKNAGEAKEVSPDKANLITSLCKDAMHAPCIDLDFPAELYPSSQIGHYHLYLNKKIPWENYVHLLNALASCEIIEKGYAQASIAKGYSSLRPVGQTKPGGMPSVKTILIENAKLKQEMNKLRQQHTELLAAHEQLLMETTKELIPVH